MATYLRQLVAPVTPQREPIPGSTQVPNSAGGFAFAVDDWQRLDRFLLLGSEGGSYYAAERALTRENADGVARCLAADGPRAVARIVAISEAGRAPKNDPAVFVLALAAAVGDARTKAAAFATLPRVCRTGTHLQHFAAYVDGLRGWGRGLRRAVAAWYAQPAGHLVYQAVKYQQRDGWSQRDLLRLAHPIPASEQHLALFWWLTKGWDWVGEEPHPDPALRPLWAFERAKRASSAAEVAALVRDYRLPREAVPSTWLDQPAVWEALLPDMPLTAMIRNLATMTRAGVLAPGSAGSAHVLAELGDAERLRRARVHPIALLSALKTYAQGHGERGKAAWTPVPALIDALDAAFYASFGTVKPSGKRLVLAVDVSGSMDGGVIAGVPGLTPRLAAAAIALVTAATEPDHRLVAFSAPSRGRHGGRWGGGDPGLTPLTISPRQRLDDVVKAMKAIPMGGTDCALPMRWAAAQKLEVDAFVVLTDSETWAGEIHPVQALAAYRQQSGLPAKLVVQAFVSNGFTIADPDDAGMLDVVGCDTATPQLIADFCRGESAAESAGPSDTTAPAAAAGSM